MAMPRALPIAIIVTTLFVSACGAASDKSVVSSSTTASQPPTPSAATPDSDYAAIPRTNILLRPPTGMRVDASLPGLSRGAGSRTSVLVIKQPVKGKSPQDALTEIADAFRGDKATAQGLDMGEVRNLTVADRPAVAVSGTQQAGGATFAKAFVVVAAGDEIVMMNGSIEQGDPLTADALLEVLAGARWSETVAPGGFGFDLTAAPGYQRGGGSGAITFVLGEGTDAAKLIAAPSIGAAAVPADRRRQAATERFATLPHSPSLQSTQEVQIAGKPGFELTGRTGEGRTVYAVMLFTDSGYILLTGDFDPAKHSDQLPAFRAMAQSIVLQ
ncbi:hypothetical protein [Lentzea sp. NPDC003310]|uniref:hypothetical protein n=1 Tax=Lentzea sp. NPDC003310 TaxID=3154447 RepID=UPI0033B5C80E